MTGGPQFIKDPLVIIYRTEPKGPIVTNIVKSDLDHCGFGLLIADLIRHAAAAYGVSGEDVVDWVNREMNAPTAKLEGGTRQ